MTTATGVVVLNFGEPSDTLACLRSLGTSRDLDLVPLVIHNGPEDDHFETLRSTLDGRVEVRASGANLGYAAGNNLGIRRVLDLGVRYVWLLNPDTIVYPDTLGGLRAVLDSSPDVGVVGPRILRSDTGRIWFDGGLVDAAHADTRHVHQGRRPERTPPEQIDVDYVTGASLFTRRAVLDDVGLIPEHYFLYYEETDWCLRARAAGWGVRVDQRVTMEHRKRSSDAVPAPYFLYYMTRNRLHFARRLGLEPEVALEQLQQGWIRRWRERVCEHAPHLLPTFDAIVADAIRDGRAGLDGPAARLRSYPDPESGAQEDARD